MVAAATWLATRKTPVERTTARVVRNAASPTSATPHTNVTILNRRETPSTCHISSNCATLSASPPVAKARPK
jgi:hypothetical protein